MFRRLTAKTVFASVVLTISVVAIAGQTRVPQRDLATSFSRYDIVRISSSRTSNGDVSLKFSTSDGSVVLALEPHDLRAAGYRAANTGKDGDIRIDRDAVMTFKGTVAGEPAGEARINIRNGQIEGFYTSEGSRYFVEPASKYSSSASTSDYVVYRLQDVIGGDGFSCATDIGQKIETGREMIGVPQVIKGLKQLKIATEADGEYVTALGGPALADDEILGILNVTEGLYTSQLGLTISVVFQHTWSTPDPYTGSNPQAVVTSFQSYWNANFPQAQFPRDTAHLFSAKPQVLSQGWAYVGVVCSAPSAAYGMSGYIDWAPGKYLVTSHEIGHNLGANHVDASEGADCANSLMNAQLSANTPLSFCVYSQNEIGSYLAANGSCLTNATACRFDFDGDSKADMTLFRPSNGAWYSSRSSAGFLGVQFGQAGDKMVAADYDGDGITDIAVYRGGTWFRLLSSTNTFDGVAFGLSTDIPAPADFDGDGKADVAVFRPSNGAWYQLLSSAGFTVYSFGQAGDVPIPADYDGDGKADINVFRPSNGVWYRMLSGTNSFYAVQFGASGDVPVTADFDGDGKADTAVWRPSNGIWYILRADNSFYGVSFGTNGDIPVPADYDGDGKADIAVFRPNSGVWYRLNSGDGSFAAYSFGLAGDQPAEADYMP